MIGKHLAHYELTGMLGKGGMGEVYSAHDTKLGRDVAIKLLPANVADDPERLARFRREAKLLAALNHPNVGALFGIEEADDQVFLVMELAEGEDLSQRLRRGAIPVDEALNVALQVAEGLEAAHAKNIVHRDLKPANVMYSPSGRVKLLDFGLARAYHGEESSGDPMMSPTITAAMTQQGMVLGTAAYMSPEQARGKAVDRQSDIWAFGVLLYEMLTAHRVFDGETISDSIGAILHKDPEWQRLPVETPPQVRQLLARCLERDRNARLHDIADARVALVEARRDPTGSSLGLSAPTPVQSSGRRTGLVALLTLVMGLAGGAWIGASLLKNEPAARTRVFDLGVEFDPSEVQLQGIQSAISPDGSAIVYTHDNHLYVQNLEEFEPRLIEHTEEAFAPFWSPDGTEIGWIQKGRLWKAPVRGGRPVALGEIRDRVAGGVGAFWGDDGRILFATGASGVNMVSERGGRIEELVAPGEGYGDLHEPSALPDGMGVIFVSHPTARGPSVLELWRNGERHVLFEAATGDRLWYPRYDPAGYILFRWTNGETTEGLWAARFDIKAGELRSTPFLLEPDASEATVDRDGTIAFIMNPRLSNQRTIARVGLRGERLGDLTELHAGGLEFALSPDGRQLAFTAAPADGGLQDQLWVRDLIRGTEVQLTAFEDRFVMQPGWSPDSKQLYFLSPMLTAGGAETLVMPADGSSPWQAVADRLCEITPDGGHLMTVTRPRFEPILSPNPDTTVVWLEVLGDPGSRRQVLGGDGVVFPSAFSPDGRYLLYYAVVAGGESTFLTRYPEFTGRWKVSLGDDVRAEAFAPDGSAIYYATETELFRVSLDGSEVPVLGRPELVGALPDGASGQLAIHPDGDSYLIAIASQAEQSSTKRRSIKVVQGWQARLQPN